MRTWMTVLALVLGLAAPLWAEDDGGAPAPQPVVENQVPPDFQPGVFDMQGNFQGNTVEEANAKMNAEYHAQPHSVWEGTPNEQHDYFDPATGQMTGVYMKQDGTVVSKEAWAEDMRQIGIKHKTDTRKWVNEAIGAEKSGYRKFGESDDARVNDVVNGTLASQQRLEQGIDDRQKQVDEEVKRVVPLRTLRSLESTGGDQR